MRRPRRNHSAAFKAKVALVTLAVVKSDQVRAQLAERINSRTSSRPAPRPR